MNKFWRRTGWTLMSFLPVLISIIAQIGLGVVYMVILMVKLMLEGGMDATDPAMIESITNSAMEAYMNDSGILIFGYHILATLGFGLWYYFGCGKPKITNPIKAFKGKCLPTVLIFSFGLCLFANAFVLIGQYVAPEAIEAYMELMEAAGLGVDTFAILASVLLAPIGEEILCRGLNFHYAKRAFNDMPNRKLAFWIANSIQAIGFGIMHLNWVQGLYAFILGLGIGWLRERYKSLYPAMLAHFVVNFSSTYIIGYILAPIPESLLSAVLIMVASILLCALGLFIGKEKTTVNAEIAA